MCSIKAFCWQFLMLVLYRPNVFVFVFFSFLLFALLNFINTFSYLKFQKCALVNALSFLLEESQTIDYNTSCFFLICLLTKVFILSQKSTYLFNKATKKKIINLLQFYLLSLMLPSGQSLHYFSVLLDILT